ncbi:MAG: MFS transporter [Thermoleophilia bacterium]|nr:MFS transporter [Thermoleophilia bacterium]
MIRASVHQLALLRRATSFRLIFLARLTSATGTFLAAIALQIDVFDRTGSGTWISALLIAEFLPTVAIGLLLGPLLDRWPRKRVLVASDLANFGAFALLPFASSPGQIVALALVSGVANGFFRPIVYAGLPNLVEKEDLESANSLLQTVENLAMLVGPPLGALIVAATSPDVTYALNAATFLVSAAFVLGVAGDRLQSEWAVSEGHWRDLAAGFAVVRRSAALFTVLVTWNIVMLTVAGVNVGSIVLAKDALGAGDVGFGVLVAGAGLGLVVGGFVSGPAVRVAGLAAAYAGGIALLGLGAVAAAVSPSIWMASACAAVFGVGNGVAVACNFLLVARGAPDQLRGRAVSVLMSLGSVTLFAGMAAAGQLTDAVGARWVWGGAGAIALVAAVVGFWLARRVPEEAPVEAPVELPPLAPPPVAVPAPSREEP